MLKTTILTEILIALVPALVYGAGGWEINSKMVCASTLLALLVLLNYWGTTKLFLKKWIKDEIISEAAKTTAVMKKLNKVSIHNEARFRYTGDGQWRLIDESFFDKDLKDMERFCKYYEKINFNELMQEVMEFSYKLGYYRRELQLQENESNRGETFRQVTRNGRFRACPEDFYGEDEASEEEHLTDFEKNEQCTEKGNIEDEIIRMIQAGARGNEIAQELGIPAYKVSRVKKKILQN